MPEALTTFRYRALTRAGEKISGEVTARDRGAAIARLQAQGLIPLLAEAVDGASLAAFLRRDLFGSATLSAKELADFMQEFATLAGAGIAVEQALATLAGPEAGRKRRRIAEDLLRRLRGGASLADAMAAEPKTFPPLALGMVRAGEAGGSLETGLTRLADYLRRSADVGEAVRSALVYPAILMATALASVVLILTVVLPQLKPIFAHAHGPLPLGTQLVLLASDIVRAWWWALLIGVAVVAELLRRLLRDPVIRTRRDRLLLRMPIVGAAIRRAETARFARLLGALAGANVALPVALALAHSVLMNTVMADAVAAVAKQLKEGGGLADPLAGTGVFPDLAIQFIRIGEATGRLDEMLLKQADLFDTEVRRLIDRGLALLVPAITILMGLIVGGIVTSVMTAILSANDAFR